MSGNPVAYEPEPSDVTADVWTRARALDAAVRSVEPTTIGSSYTGTQRQEILARAARFERFIRDGADDT